MNENDEDLRNAKEYADGYRNGFEDGFHEAMSLCRELYNPPKEGSGGMIE